MRRAAEAEYRNYYTFIRRELFDKIGMYSADFEPDAPLGECGALFWLNAGSASNPADRRWQSIPRDAFWANGFQEQRVVIIPSSKLVLVRLGNCSYRAAWDDEKFISEVLAALPQS